MHKVQHYSVGSTAAVKSIAPTKRHGTLRYFLLLRLTEAVRCDVKPNAKNISYKGCVCVMTDTEHSFDTYGRSTLDVTVIDFPDTILKVYSKDLREIDEETAQVLLGIPSFSERLLIVNEKVRLSMIPKAQLNAHVIVGLPTGMARGVIRFRGPLDDGAFSGTLFGIELLECHRGKGNTNGTDHMHRYFTCDEDCGIFVGFHRIAEIKRVDSGIDQDKHLVDGNGLYSSSRSGGRTAHGLLSSSPDHLTNLTIQQYGGRVGERDSASTGVTGCSNLVGRRLARQGSRGTETPPPAPLMTSSNRVVPETSFLGRNSRYENDCTMSTSVDLVVKSSNEGRSKVGVVDASVHKRRLTENLTWHHGEATLPLEGHETRHTCPEHEPGTQELYRSQINMRTNHRNQHTWPDSTAESSSRVGRKGKASMSKASSNLATCPSTGNVESCSDRFSPCPEKVDVEEDLMNDQQSLKDLVLEEDLMSEQDFFAGEENSLFEVGSVVEVLVKNKQAFGVIRWMGTLPGKDGKFAGVEMEEEVSEGTDGTCEKKSYFICPPGKGLFVRLGRCHPDSRFPLSAAHALDQVQRCNSIAFSNYRSETVKGIVMPPSDTQALSIFSGRTKGIQGHLNSCYMDSTLFCMFALSTAFDGMLHRPMTESDSREYNRVQRLLREDIVNPLRRHGYVSATKVMQLRKELDSMGCVTGLTNEEKDPEEFLNILFQHVLKVEPFLKISSEKTNIQESYLYQIFLERDGRVQVPTVQQLLEQSFHTADLKLTEMPSCLIVQAPRFGREFKMFSKIIPSLELDITNLLQDSPRECVVCERSADVECRDCYLDMVISPGQIKQYCNTCSQQVHHHRGRINHTPRELHVPPEFRDGASRFVPRECLQLFGVLCIETSHYVAFLKYGAADDAWLFFDSMADREGGQDGFNIPEVRPCPEVAQYLSLHPDQLDKLDSRQMTGSASRLFCDAYMFMYHHPQLMQYK
uniref:ubiquitinyl hydrolase 1 n=2 Tax=Eptatretus burgeri TaxID=7764 RepID=A0A8C4R4A6_EPTBU